MAESTSKQIAPFYQEAIKENHMVSICGGLKSKFFYATEPMDTSPDELSTPKDAVIVFKHEILYRLNAIFEEIKTLCEAEYREQCNTESLLSCLDLPTEPTGRNDK